MRLLRGGHSTDVPHIIQPYVRAKLKEFDAIIISPYMGLDQFKEFGEKIFIDCCGPYGHYEDAEGNPLWKKVEQMALERGLSVIIHADYAFYDNAPKVLRNEERK